MRTLTIIAGLGACVALAGCEQSSSQASTTEVAAPAVKKSIARPRQLYAGQEQILSVDAAALDMDQGKLVLNVKGKTPGAGYTDVAFVPRIYPAAPKDGIYEVDVVAMKPSKPGAATPTPVEIEKAWEGYPEGRLKGVTFITKTNQVTAMLPAPKAGS
ncbi:hypothetical protein [Phenylobacterium sp.]|jgi:hypothetical protein|uniref:hypothetical protein n=1 Tax=Phenylobacterium sp. TaxID=1871053 RepID=UPI002F93737A